LVLYGYCFATGLLEGVVLVGVGGFFGFVLVFGVVFGVWSVVHA